MDSHKFIILSNSSVRNKDLIMAEKKIRILKITSFPSIYIFLFCLFFLIHTIKKSAKRLHLFEFNCIEIEQ